MTEQMPDREAVEFRTRLGWSEGEARVTPMRKMEHADGRVNVAAYARSLDATPSKVQKAMREGLDLDDAVEATWKAEGQL